MILRQQERTLTRERAVPIIRAAEAPETMMLRLIREAVAVVAPAVEGIGDDDVTTSSIRISDTENGETSVTPEDAEEGDSVVITATPEEGYVLESLTVTDSEGNELEMTENEDGTWTFTMPDGEVTIETVFREKPEDYFADITGTWAADDINQLADLGVVTGNPDENVPAGQSDHKSGDRGHSRETVRPRQ